MKTNFLKKNISFIIPIIILLSLSVLNMYGASFISPLYQNSLKRQTVWIIASIFIFTIVYRIDIRIFYRNSTLFYLLGNILLLLVLFLGKNVNGASSWFKIGAISIQPSELFKFFYIVFIAKITNKHKGGSISLIIKVIFYTFIPCILIFLEPDTGVVVMYLLIMFGEILASKIDKRLIVIIMIIGITLLSSFLGLYFLKSELFIKVFGTSFFYRMDRLLSFTNNSSYQLNNALIGIGASGLLGLGLTSSKIYVPEVITDFVFDLTIMNFGYIVGILVILLYAFLLVKIYIEMTHCKKYLHKCILSGIFWMMLFQIFEHILMNIGLTPITGITLPFLSYGGSSMVSYAMLFALILKITTNNSSYN